MKETTESGPSQDNSETNVEGESKNVQKEEKEEKPKNVLFTPDETNLGAHEGENDGWIDILGTGHIKKKILKPSTSGVRPERTDTCTISYDGFLEEKIVDSVKDVKIHLGDLEVIHGIDLALALMEVGEEAELVVGPRFAYGNLGLKPAIPPSSTIRYIISLSAVESEISVLELPIDKRLELGNKKKERGNWWYSREEHPFAIQCYRRALEYFDETEIPQPCTNDEFKKLIEDKLKTYNNLAAAQIKVNAFDGALMSLSHVLTFQPKNLKALYRKAKILKEQGAIEESIHEVRKALAIEPDSQSLNQELSSLLAILRENNARQVNLFKKMMGNDSITENSASNEPDSTNTSNGSTSWRWLAVVSFAAAVIGAFAMKYKY